MLKTSFLSICLSCLFLFAKSQAKLSVENVHATYLRNSGTIMEHNQIKGYFFFYQSDKINKSTNQYTLQITDNNLKKLKDIKFEDSKDLMILESSFN